MASMDVIESFPLTDEILSGYREIIGDDYDGYRNHVTRMLNFCVALGEPLSTDDLDKYQIAAAFHDIALWTHDRVDYLEPSVADCMMYLDETGRASWKEEIAIIIDMHHLMSPYHGKYERLTERFRKADLVDFSLGIVKFGLSKDTVSAVKQAIPNAGFHKTLMRFTGKQLMRAPWDPLPMMRVKNKYRDRS